MLFSRTGTYTDYLCDSSSNTYEVGHTHDYLGRGPEITFLNPP